MKLKENLVLRQVADSWIVLPVGSKVLNFDGMLHLNESGVILWKALAERGSREAMIDALLSEYDVQKETATEDVDTFLANLRQAGCLEG